MNNEIKGKDDTWHYLEVNRGRYLCSRHGGFCDSSDGYSKVCPLCGDDCKGSVDKNNWQVNPIDRVLQVMKNLQSRSIRIIQILSGVTGFLGLLSIFKEDNPFTFLSDLGYISWGFLALFIVCFITSFICYLRSMPHMKTTNLDGITGFSKKPIDKWEDYIAKHLAKFEWYHTIGTRSLAWSGGFLILFILAQLITPLICK